MSRILLGMAGLNTILLLVTFGVGFVCEGRAYIGPDASLTATQRMFTFHLLGGLAAALLSLLLHSLVFTYFIGTGRWVQEVVKAYGLSGSLLENTRALKIRALPFILGSVLLVIATATCGAATDRGLLDRNVHLIIAVCAIAVNFWSYLREYQVVVANNQIIVDIMAQVTQMRRELGLDLSRRDHVAASIAQTPGAEIAPHTR
jgi:hypothetical protein